MLRRGLFLLLIFLSFFISGAHAAPKVIKISGKAEILKITRWVPAQQGMPIESGTKIRVIGKGEITLEDTETRIIFTGKSNTTFFYNGLVQGGEVPWKNSRRVRLLTSSEEKKGQPITQFFCPVGIVEIKVTPGAPLNVVTPLIAAAVRGTGFRMAVAKDSSSSILVTEGLVSVYDRLGNATELGAGQKSSVTSGQYVDHLRQHGISIPSKDFDWRRLDPELLEILDDQLLQKHFRMEAAREDYKKNYTEASRSDLRQNDERGGDGGGNSGGGGGGGSSGGGGGGSGGGSSGGGGGGGSSGGGGGGSGGGGGGSGGGGDDDDDDGGDDDDDD